MWHVPFHDWLSELPPTLRDLASWGNRRKPKDFFEHFFSNFSNCYLNPAWPKTHVCVNFEPNQNRFPCFRLFLFVFGPVFGVKLDPVFVVRNALHGVLSDLKNQKSWKKNVLRRNFFFKHFFYFSKLSFLKSAWPKIHVFSARWQSIAKLSIERLQLPRFSSSFSHLLISLLHLHKISRIVIMFCDRARMYNRNQ